MRQISSSLFVLARQRVEMAPKKRRVPTVQFSNELILQEAIRGLLQRIPEVSLVERTHGPTERGKDLVFYLPGGLGRPLLCAAVVKNVPISGNVASTAGAPTVLNQVRQAFSQPILLGDGSAMHVAKVFVISPFDIPQEALHSILGLEPHASQCEFIGGTQLNELLKRYWPDYVEDEFSALNDHLKRVSLHLNEDNPVQRLGVHYHFSGSSKTLQAVYVQPRFHAVIKSYSAEDYFKSLVYDGFGNRLQGAEAHKPVIERVTRPREIRRVITFTDVAEVSRASRALAEALPVLSDWNYCSSADRVVLTEAQTNYLELTTSLAGKLMVKPRSSRQKSVKLSAFDSRRLTGAATRLREQLGVGLSHLNHDMVETQLLVGGTIEGGEALRHSGFLLAPRLSRLAAICPPINAIEDDKRTFTFEASLLNELTSSVLIVGPAGYGKTSFCRWNALNDADRFQRDSSAPLPVYVPLGEVHQEATGSFERVFLAHAGRSALIQDGIVGQIERGEISVRLYLDGLDEIPSAERRADLMDLAREGVGRWKNVHVVVTARDYVTGEWLEWLPRITLSRFKPDQISTLVSNWLDQASERQTFMRQLERVPALRSVMEIPLLATLTLLVFRQTKDLPRTRTRLFEIFVKLLAEGWDLAKQVNRGSRFGPAVKEAVLQRLALTCHSTMIRRASEDDFDSAVSACLRRGRTRSDRREVLDEVLRDGLLVRTGGHLTFAHLSFQEFCAAASLLGEPRGRRATSVLRSYLRGDNWWLEVMRFYVGLSGKPKELSNWIADTQAKLGEAEQELAGRQARRLLAEIRTTHPDLSEH